MDSRKIEGVEVTLQQLNGLGLMRAISLSDSGKREVKEAIEYNIQQFQPSGSVVRPATSDEQLEELAQAQSLIVHLFALFSEKYPSANLETTLVPLEESGEIN